MVVARPAPPTPQVLHVRPGTPPFARECGTVLAWHPPPTVGSGAGRSESPYRSGAGRWVIAATVLGSSMAAIDATVIGIALPTIGRDFHASLGTLQWVVTGYTLTLASLLLLGGSLGDHYGRRRVFMIGVGWFAVASAACCGLHRVGQLIATRLLQGVGGALLTPGSLAILEASFATDDRNEAIGAWSGLGGVATAAGPFLGGYLIAAASWRWIFLINIPIGAAVLVLLGRHVPESRDPSVTGRVDAVGAALVTASLGTHHLRADRRTGTRLDGTGCGGGTGRRRDQCGGLRRGRAPVGGADAATRTVPQPPVRGHQRRDPRGLRRPGGGPVPPPGRPPGRQPLLPLESGIASLPPDRGDAGLLGPVGSGGGPDRAAPPDGCRTGDRRSGPGPAGPSPGSSSYLAGVLPVVLVIAIGLATTVAPLTATALNSVPSPTPGLPPR